MRNRRILRGRPLLRTVSIQFYVGGAGAGAQPHWHGPAWNWLLRGRKKWLLWPPEGATYAQRHVGLAVEPATQLSGRPLECEQRAGDVLVLPALWGHATLNAAPSIGFATELHFDRQFDLGLHAEFGDEWWRTTNDRPKEKQAKPKRRAAEAEPKRAPPERKAAATPERKVMAPVPQVDEPPPTRVSVAADGRAKAQPVQIEVPLATVM